MLGATAHNRRVLSGMRPTGRLHLGHFHGVLKNWVQLQYDYECFFFVADWHALTTEYENKAVIRDNIWEMVIDWLAVGVDPASASIFIQSHVPEHAELHLLLSMMTPLGWLERVPSYKDQQEKLREKDIDTYGFLGYPLLQSADILAYKAGHVPVGEDQVAHVELTREVARRFNFLYGREDDFVDKVEAAIKKMGRKNARLYSELRRQFQEQGDHEALERARALLDGQQNITLADRTRLYGYMSGEGRVILPEPQALLTPTAKMPGLDGQKMSKSYHNTITLRDDPETVEKKVRTMPTDPARVRRTDPGNPDKCPVWPFHQIYSSTEAHQWVAEGCRAGSIGCLDCKQLVINGMQEELTPIRERAAEYSANEKLVQNIVAEGSEKARCVVRKTMEEVRSAMGLIAS